MFRLEVTFAGIVAFVCLLAIPFSIAHAMGAAADAMCSGCQMDPTKPMYCPTVPCFDVTNGFTTSGMCVLPGKCLAQASSGGFGLDQVSQILGPLMQQLMKGNQNGSASANDTTLPSPCQTVAPTGVSATLLSSSGASTTPPTSAPCDYGTGVLSTWPTSPLTSSFTGSIPGEASALTNALTGASCTDSTLCGLSSLAGGLASPTSTAASGNGQGQSSASLVPQNAIVPTVAVASTTSGAASTQSGASGLYNTGSSVAPQGLTVSKDSSAVIFHYAPIGQNAQIAGFISCDVSAANSVPYVPLSAIQNACR